MWSQIIGHSRQIDQLRRALDSQRLAGAWLFTGPRGVGKRTVANILAAAIACPTARTNGWEPCGKCPGCIKSRAGSHPDIFIIEPESEQKEIDVPEASAAKSKKPRSENLKIDQIRELKSRIIYHPLEAPSKIAIIDEADRMTEGCANSLLKILEEPPTSTHFILISTLPHMLLPTIRSRCQTIVFGPLQDNELAQALVRDGKMTAAEALRIAKLAGGSLGTALSIDPEFASEVLTRFGAICKTPSSADVIATAENWSHSDSTRMRLVFDLLASWYRDICRFHSTGETASLIHPEAVRAARECSGPKAERALAAISNAQRASETAANKQLMFEHLLFTLTS